MHRMNANRVTNNGTSTLDDGSIRRIEDGVRKASDRRANKHRKSASIKKTAKKAETEAQNSTKRIVVASLGDVPENFERIGTGFYREGHHLWEIAPGEGGFVLTRRHGEDHVLGYDPEPMKKESAVLITDRFGRELKKGSKVRLPLRGKVATGTIVVITPGTLDVGLENGEMASCPPGMAECLDGEEVLEDESDIDAGSVFEPDISEESKSDYVGPQSAQTGGIGGVAAESDDMGDDGDSGDDGDEDHEFMASKTAQTDQGTQTVTQQPEAPAAEPSFPSYEPNKAAPMGRIAEELETKKTMAVISKNEGEDYATAGIYLISKISDGKYDVDVISQSRRDLVELDAKGLAEFEHQLGSWYEAPGFSALARVASRDVVVAAMLDIHKVANAQPSINMKDWKAYWQAVGARVAQKAPPKPKLTEEEKKQRRKERKKQRDIERSGLPKGTKLPPKASAKDSDERAKLKEIIKIYESGVDELEYALNSIEPEDPNADALAMDAVTQTLERIREEREELEGGEKEEMDRELSLEEPSEMELGTQLKTSEKIVVSMSEL